MAVSFLAIYGVQGLTAIARLKPYFFTAVNENWQDLALTATTPLWKAFFNSVQGALSWSFPSILSPFI